MASQSAQNAKKSARATEDYGFAAETPTERYRAFKGLSREQMDEILGMASRFREQNREELTENVPGFWRSSGRKRRKTASARAGAGALNLFNIMEDHPDLVVEALRIQ